MPTKAKAQHDRFTPPLMFAFREAFRQRDAGDIVENRNEAGERVLAARRASPRSMIGETALKADLTEDLTSLFNTVNLESAESLEGMEFVRKSILNFGLNDLTTITADSAKALGLAGWLKDAVYTHEARLIENTVQILQEDNSDSTTSAGNIKLHVRAEMHAAPADLAIEFVTDVEAGTGRSKVSKL